MTLLAAAGRTLRAPAMQIGLALAIGQTVVYATTPVLTRLYSTAEVGAGGIFLACASILGSICTLRFEAQLPRADPQQAVWLTRSALRSIVAVSALGGVGYALLGSSATSNGAALLEGLFFGSCVGGLGVVALSMQWAARRGQMRSVALSKVVQGLGQSTTQVGAGAAGSTGLGLQLGFTVGYVAAALVQTRGLVRHGWRRMRSLSHATAITDSRGLVRQSVLLTVATAINMATVWALPLVVRWTSGIEEAGVLTVAQRLAVAPAGLAVAAVSPVVLAAAGAELRAGRPPWAIARRWVLRLAPLGLLAGAVMLLVPERLLTLVLGPGWAGVPGYLAALTPLVVGQVVVGPVSQLLSAAGHSGSQLVWDASRFAVVIATAVICRWASAGPVLLTSLVCTILASSYVAYLAVLRHQTHAVQKG